MQEELRFDQHLMRSPSMEIWELGIHRAMDFMEKFFGYRNDPRVDLKDWALQVYRYVCMYVFVNIYV